MATKAFIGNYDFYFYNAASSPQMQPIPEVTDFSGFGQTNPLVDATSFDSTAREYIAGLPDGDEITLKCIDIPDNVIQVAMRAAVAAQATRAMRVVATNYNVSPQTVETYNFNAVCVGWKKLPSVDGKNEAEFTFKISGAITET